MEPKESASNKKSPLTAGPKKASKLPSKAISFSNHPTAKNGKQGKVTLNKSKKGGVNLMKKLSGM